jgi:hypothetical protein
LIVNVHHIINSLRCVERFQIYFMYMSHQSCWVLGALPPASVQLAIYVYRVRVTWFINLKCSTLIIRKLLRMGCWLFYMLFSACHTMLPTVLIQKNHMYYRDYTKFLHAFVIPAKLTSCKSEPRRAAKESMTYNF